ncbi:MAG: hypothetical protein UY05_C0007G0006 [Candidatus Peregrinibacteria bacterium GW2011_GWA2_47_7]|nr:MAG: hypothetical protein UY05_C0007G0006 [Candidatus Peregrinibacteria bacterium GW2011_GWA2_47_7]
MALKKPRYETEIDAEEFPLITRLKNWETASVIRQKMPGLMSLAMHFLNHVKDIADFFEEYVDFLTLRDNHDPVNNAKKIIRRALSKSTDEVLVARWKRAIPDLYEDEQSDADAAYSTQSTVAGKLLQFKRPSP